MSVRRTLQVCRLLVAILMFNMVAPVVVAAESDQLGYVLLCTSAGLVQVEIEGADNQQASAPLEFQHCPYCKFSDQPQTLNADNLSHPVPDTPFASRYPSLTTPLATRYILNYVQLRAPPTLI